MAWIFFFHMTLAYALDTCTSLKCDWCTIGHYIHFFLKKPLCICARVHFCGNTLFRTCMCICFKIWESKYCVNCIYWPHYNKSELIYKNWCSWAWYSKIPMCTFLVVLVTSCICLQRKVERDFSFSLMIFSLTYGTTWTRAAYGTRKS